MCDVCASSLVLWSTCGSQRRTTLGFTAFAFFLIGDRVFLRVTAASAELVGLGAAGDFLTSAPTLIIGEL